MENIESRGNASELLSTNAIIYSLYSVGILSMSLILFLCDESKLASTLIEDTYLSIICCWLTQFVMEIMAHRITFSNGNMSSISLNILYIFTWINCIIVVSLVSYVIAIMATPHIVIY